MFGRPGPSGSNPRRRPSRSAPISSPFSPAPSASLLSLLATVAASVPVVDGSPAPLLFLYPRHNREAEDRAQEGVPREGAEPETLSPAVGTSSQRATRRRVPTKYEQTTDGRWKKAETYSLYGSTMCSICEGTSALEGGYQAGASMSPQSTSTPLTETDAVDILDTLPIGWKPRDREPKTTLIVTLSLVLAFVICFLIIGCLFWRKTVRRKSRQHDVEMRPTSRRRPAQEEDEDALTDREVRRQKKIWARASARWRAHARVRQRRGRRGGAFVTRSSPSADVPASNEQDDLTDRFSYTSRSRSSSRPSSRLSSTPAGDVPDSASSADASVSNITQEPFSHPPPNSPPAYQNARRVSGPQVHITTANLDSVADAPKSTSSVVSPLSPSYHLHHSRRPSPVRRLSSTDDPPDPVYSLSTAHVATDDKAVLQRLGQLASSPPEDGNIVAQVQESSAPAWDDEELDDFDEEDRHQPSSSGSQNEVTPSSFPPPPLAVSSKGKMAAEYYEYDYSYSTFDEDIQALGPELGPSAPPFEAVASAPPLSEASNTPSAPAMEELGETSTIADDPPPSNDDHVVSPPVYQT